MLTPRFLALQGNKIVAIREGRNRLQLRMFVEEIRNKRLPGDIVIWHCDASVEWNQEVSVHDQPRAVAIVYDQKSGFEPLLLFTSPPIKAIIGPCFPEFVNPKKN